MITIIKIDNCKREDCAGVIKKHLLAVEGVNNVIIDTEQGEITISYYKVSLLNDIKKELKKIGFPETGSSKVLENITCHVKSAVGCSIGNISSAKIKN